MSQPEPPPVRCPTCRGTGIDPAAKHRYTTGGRDDRTCATCLGECRVYPPLFFRSHEPAAFGGSVLPPVEADDDPTAAP